MTNETMVKTLNALIMVCRDSEDELRTAALGIDGEPYPALLRYYANQRHRFSLELIAGLLKEGKKPRVQVVNATSRTWISLLKAVSQRDRAAIFRACERGEQETVRVYSLAMRVPLPDHLHHLIERQYPLVQTSYEKLRSLRDFHNYQLTPLTTTELARKHS